MIRLRTEHLDIARAVAGLNETTADLAKAMGMAPSAVGRVLTGKRPVAGDFVNGMKRAFPQLTVEQLFEFVDNEQAIAS